MNSITKRNLWPVLCILIIGFISCNSDEDLLEPFDKNHLVGTWQESGRNGIVSLNDNFYEFRDNFTFEQCLEGGCWDGAWEWMLDGTDAKIKFDFSEPTGGWWQEFEIAYLDSDSLEVTVFDYVEGRNDPMGSGIVMSFTKINQ